MEYAIIQFYASNGTAPHAATVTSSVTPWAPENATTSSSRTTQPYDPDDSAAYVFMRRLQTVVIPVICVLGIAGNVLAAGTFLSPGLNKTSCCFHLASKCINDIGFLFSLFVVWLYRIRVPLFTTPGVCQVTVFLTYVCGCLSVWFVVGITTENFIRFTQPCLVQRYCNVAVAKRMVAGITFTSCLFYNGALWTTGIVEQNQGQGLVQCTSLERFRTVVMATTVIDTTLTLIVPTVLMAFLVAAIVGKTMESWERKKRLRKASESSRCQPKRMTPEGKMTTFLFVVSFIFITLNLPLHSIRLKLLIQYYLYDQNPSPSDIILQRIFEVFLYCNFSTNCLIYLVFGERFRGVFCHMYLAHCCPRYGTAASNGEATKDASCQAAEHSGESPTTYLMLKERAGYETTDDESVCLTCVADT